MGFFAPSAAGAIGAAGAALIAAFSRRLSLKDFWESLLEAARLSTVLFFVFIGGLLLSRALLIMGFISDLNDMILAYGISESTFLAIIILMYFVLGMFIDSVSVMVITLSFVFPLSQSLGLNPVWFSVLLIKMVEIAAITPPVGLNLYAVMAASKGEVSANQIFKGILPFVLLEFGFLAILIIFPEIATWLPAKMKE